MRFKQLLLFLGLATVSISPIAEAADFKTADAELNKVYQAILKAYKDRPEFTQKLKIAQRAWIKFRDAHAESVFPAKDKLGEYGSVYRVCYAQIMASLTEQRTRQLWVWIKGTEEGDVCAGSVKRPDELR